MNLKEFTEAVDHMTRQMDQGQLHLLIHSFTRNVPEEFHKHFIELIEDIQGSGTVENDEGKLEIHVKKVDGVEIRREMQWLKKLFCEIKNEEISIQASG